MTKENAIRLFESKKVRVLWDDSVEKWYFSVIDIIKILSESKNPRRYWSDLKIKLNKEGSQLYDKIVQLKMVAFDGKKFPRSLPMNGNHEGLKKDKNMRY